MALIQFDLDDLYTEALDHVSRANGMSRRAYMTDYIQKCLEMVPGLMAMIKNRKASGWEMTPDMYVPEYKNILIPDAKPRMKRYRFKPLDGGPPIEGVGSRQGQR